MQQLNFIENGKPTYNVIHHDIFLSVKPHIREKFWKYHSENPELFDLYLKFARQLKNSRRNEYGIAAITERIRWHFAVETVGDDFKINNNYKSCYARLLAITYPEEFRTFFKIRGHI